MTGIRHRYLQVRSRGGSGAKPTQHRSGIDEVLEYVITADGVKWPVKRGEDILDRPNPQVIYGRTCA